MNVRMQYKDVLVFDILNLPKTISRYRAHLQKKPQDAVTHANLVMALDLADEVPTEKAQAERRRWYEAHVAKFARGDSPHAVTLDPERQLKIGYMSADVRQHSAMYAIAPIIGYHDRTKFHVSVYSSTVLQDHYTGAIKGSADRFYDLSRGWNDAQVAYLIEADRIDILIDCSGHSAGFRLATLAHKPAPVQISAFGYNLGTGLPQVDYLVSDPVHIVTRERSLYSERILDMPCMMTYQAPPYAPPVAPLPCREGGLLAFGVLNRLEKISDSCLRSWSSVMKAIDSKIIVKDRHLSDRNTRRTLIRRMVAAGIREERIDLRGVSSHIGQLETFNQIDIQLDTYPQGGGISTAEALYMGAPVLTLRGRVPASRTSATILSCIGHPEWIAETESQYVQKAIELASNRERLAEIRANLRAEVSASEFGNPQRYTRIFEGKLRDAWRAYCQ
jgi:predicted O-linked N-acetylglucosamine transferase (SPINDLY family)